MAQTVGAQAPEISDADVEKYWTVFSRSENDMHFAVTHCEHSSYELAQAHHDQISDTAVRFEARRGMLSRLHVPEEMWLEAVDGEGPSIFGVALENPHYAEAAMGRWDSLDLSGKRRVLSNRGATPEFLDRHYNTAYVHTLMNPATGVSTLEKIFTNPDKYSEWFDVTLHQAAKREWVVTVLDTGNSTERSTAVSWPGFTNDELENLTGDPDEKVAGAALYELNARLTTDEGCSVSAVAAGRAGPPLNTGTLRPGVLALLDGLDDDRLAAARALVRAGFNGTVGELLAIAATFT